MKKLFTLLLAFVVAGVSIAAAPTANISVNPKKNASDIYIPIGRSGEKISLLELSKISRSGLEKITGKKMNFIERHAFRSAQKKLKKGIDSDGVITDLRLQKMFGSGQGGDDGSSFNLGGFALGLLLGPIGVLIAYLLNDDKKKNRIKWAWIGFAASILLYLLLIVSVF